MRRFYVSPEILSNKLIELNLEESRHLREVLRLRVNDEVSVFDGEGREVLCCVKELGEKKNPSVLQPLREIPPASPESDLDLSLGIALLKGEKFDLVVQKCVELGVTKIVPLSTKRADAKIARLERWRKIAIESAKQSGRAKLMQITELVDFNYFVKTSEGTKLLFSERNGASFSEIKSNKRITAVIGAEGGWDDSEIEWSRKNGFQIITLSGRILRSETAAIAISAILQNRFGDLF